jgi:hypothetical protein
MSLCEAHGELTGEGKEEEGEEEAEARHGELLGEGEGAPWGLPAALHALLCRCGLCCSCLYVRNRSGLCCSCLDVRNRKKEGGWRKREEKKKYGKFLGKNKRQLMKLIKII